MELLIIGTILGAYGMRLATFGIHLGATLAMVTI